VEAPYETDSAVKPFDADAEPADGGLLRHRPFADVDVQLSGEVVAVDRDVGPVLLARRIFIDPRFRSLFGNYARLWLPMGVFPP